MKIEFQFDLDEARRKLKAFERKSEQDILKAMQKVEAAALEEAVKRAPIDEGNLQLSLQSKTEVRFRAYVAIVYVATNSPASDYALVMHEDDYELGPLSQQKQAALPGVRVGHKYLERAFTEEKAKYVKILETELKEAFRAD
ncbi:hypothetical protein [Desulfocurvibacter africanus]|uniref:hypothetical protein n=1 Tax=Desulfocurvibacter africanus TaxID=873 RepID=UPI0003FCC65B|nr:hypothetical protein [Desulfocurvibacter africanus]